MKTEQQEIGCAPTPSGSMAGFSLIEILVAMVILITGMVSVLALFISAVSIHKKALDGTHSTLIAESAFQAVRAQLAEGSIESIPRAAATDFPGYDVQVTVTPLDLVGGEVLAEVSVFWRAGKTEEGVEVFTSILPVDDFRESIRRVREASSGATQNP